VSVDDKRIRLSDDTVSALCGSAQARALLHPEADVDTAVLRREADALVTGSASVDLARRTAALVEASPRLLPPGFDLILPHLGIDAKGMLALAITIPEDLVTVVDPDDQVAQLHYAQSDMAWICLSRDPATARMTVGWRDTELVIPAVPQTVAALLKGRPLETVIDHPALRGLGVTIAEVRQMWEDDSYMEIVTSLHADRQRDDDAVTARARASLARVTQGVDDVDDLVLRPIYGNDLTGVLHGMGPAQIGINPELARLHSDRDLDRVMADLVEEWKRDGK
jgi:hypothetical protein